MQPISGQQNDVDLAALRLLIQCHGRGKLLTRKSFRAPSSADRKPKARARCAYPFPPGVTPRASPHFAAATMPMQTASPCSARRNPCRFQRVRQRMPIVELHADAVVVRILIAHTVP